MLIKACIPTITTLKGELSVAKILVNYFKRDPLSVLVAVHPLPSLYLKVPLLIAERSHGRITGLRRPLSPFPFSFFRSRQRFRVSNRHPSLMQHARRPENPSEETIVRNAYSKNKPCRRSQLYYNASTRLHGTQMANPSLLFKPNVASVKPSLPSGRNPASLG